MALIFQILLCNTIFCVCAGLKSAQVFTMSEA